MNTYIQINQYDTGIILTFFCQDDDKNTIDLTSYTVDFFISRNGINTNEGRSACEKSDPSIGIAEYTLTSEDTAQTGIYQGKLRITSGVSEVRSVSGIILQIQ